ncbi:hypothetical protein FHS83_000680 [Rhizomicrobium palustre]|uniref:Uncharacterized protein n=1 Tax=Rhizomicrobium palustre TaxID=189966 RepID=A0A846MWB0_9PROT|nr:hypothetical protein [Rhizomicrobium palustre]NIK87362.1 hypothetical protein [Rhizomicrobium palustre]
MLITETPIRSEPKSLDAYRQYIHQVMEIQSETVRRLADTEAMPPIEMAALLEDVANTFLDLSDEIRDFALGRPKGEGRGL